MRAAIAAAEVGDEQRGLDPTTLALQERVAALLGHEAGLFLPSGTMCNEIALRLHARPGGDEVLLDRTAHPVNSEAGGPAQLAGLMVRVLEGERGVFTAAQLEAAVRPAGNRYMPRSSLVCVEQTSNLGGGHGVAAGRGARGAGGRGAARVRTHIDGARLLNAVVASGVSADAIRRRVRLGLARFHEGAGRAGRGRPGRLTRVHRRGVAVEADARRRLPAVGDRGRGLSIRARSQRRALGDRSRERTGAGARAGFAGRA